MEIIPVVDLMHGVVVRARRGERSTYEPLSTPLSPTSRPLDVVAGFLRRFPIRLLYVADLDAILGRGNQTGVISEIARMFPQLRLLVDAGRSRVDGGANVLDVVGSESLSSMEDYAQRRAAGSSVLSLDFRGDEFLGPLALAASPSLWPQRVIVMTLAKIGAGEGPDFARFAKLRALAPQLEYFAAGGVRGARDLDQLARAGAAGALLSTALHDGTLSREDFARFAAP